MKPSGSSLVLKAVVSTWARSLIRGTRDRPWLLTERLAAGYEHDFIIQV